MHLKRMAVCQALLAAFWVACFLFAGSMQARAAGPSADRLNQLIQQATSSIEQGRHAEALQLAQRAVALASEAYGARSLELASALTIQAIARSRLGQYDQALPLEVRALAIRETVLGPEHPDTARNLGNLALTYSALGQYDQALRLEVRALAVMEKVLGPEHPDTAIGLSNLASTYSNLGRYDEALPLAVRALAVSENALGPEHPGTAFRLTTLASTYSNLGRYDEALPLAVRALVITENALGPGHPYTALRLGDLASMYFDLGRYDDALPLAVRALAVSENALGPEHPDTAFRLAKLASTYSALGRYDEALPLAVRALAILERALGPEHPDTAVALSFLASTYFDLGQYELALPLQLRALRMTERALGTEHSKTAFALGALAWTYAKLAQYDQALPLAMRALAIAENASGPEHPDAAFLLSYLASTYSKLGQYHKALPLHVRALTITERILGPEHPDTANRLDNLALTYSYLGQYDQALPLGVRALAITEKVLGPEHPVAATRLGNLAWMYANLGQYDQALLLDVRALAITEKVLGPEHPDTANRLGNVALAYSNLGRYLEALPLAVRALVITEKALGPEHSDTALRFATLASISRRMEQPAQSIAFYKASVNSLQTSRAKVSRIGLDEVRSYTGRFAHAYQELAAVLTDQSRLAEAQLVLDMLKEDEQFDFIRRSSNADPRRTRIDYTPVEQKWMGRYREIADRLAALGKEDQELQLQARLGLTEIQKQRQAKLAADLKVAQAAFAANLDEMRKEFARKGPARNVELAESSQKSLAELQGLIKTLGDGAVLLQIYISDTRLNFLLTTSGVQIARHVTIDPKELNRQIGAFRRALRDPKSDPLPPAQAMYKLLLAPVDADLVQAGARTVMLSLDGSLRYVPFGSLHDGRKYAVERWNLPLYNSVVRERLRDAVKPTWQAAGLGVTRQQGEFSPLPGVRAEMASIVRSGNGGVLPGEVHLDEDFTATRLKDVTQRRFPVVHVASHFQFSPGTEINSFLVLGDGTRLSLGDIRTQDYRFDDVDLLTLSACDTGLGGGRDERGQEIEGFGVIAQQQGAKAVLATLWPVADQSTASLMADMYRKRQSGSITKIEALRQAQRALSAQAKYSHPYYWAPFILMGNWK
jgi:CHAT domain-containing protein